MVSLRVIASAPLFDIWKSTGWVGAFRLLPPSLSPASPPCTAHDTRGQANHRQSGAVKRGHSPAATQHASPPPQAPTRVTPGTGPGSGDLAAAAQDMTFTHENDASILHRHRSGLARALAGWAVVAPYRSAPGCCACARPFHGLMPSHARSRARVGHTDHDAPAGLRYTGRLAACIPA